MENLPNMSEVELLESMTPDQIVRHILDLGEKIDKLEKNMNLASEVLEDAYGLSVDQVLTRNDCTLLSIDGGEKQNGEKY